MYLTWLLKLTFGLTCKNCRTFVVVQFDQESNCWVENNDLFCLMNSMLRIPTAQQISCKFVEGVEIILYVCSEVHPGIQESSSRYVHASIWNLKLQNYKLSKFLVEFSILEFDSYWGCLMSFCWDPISSKTCQPNLVPCRTWHESLLLRSS